MTDARPATQMMVVDWSGRRMLAVREPEEVVPGVGGLLKRLTRVEGFSRLALRWAESSLLGARILDVLTEVFRIPERRPWDFLADAPEGEVLALRSRDAMEEMSSSLARRAMRRGLFSGGVGPRKRPIRIGSRQQEPGQPGARSLGFRSPRSEVPMGTVSTPGPAGAFRTSGSSGIPMGVAFPTGARSRSERRSEIGRGAIRPVRSGGSGLQEEAPPLGISGLGVSRPMGTAERVQPPAIALEAPEAALLLPFHARIEDSSSETVFLGRIVERSDPRTVLRGLPRSQPESATRKPPEIRGPTPTEEVRADLRSAFRPRRSDVVAPWFASAGASTSRYRWSEGSAATGPVLGRLPESDVRLSGTEIRTGPWPSNELPFLLSGLALAAPETFLLGHPRPVHAKREPSPPVYPERTSATRAGLSRMEEGPTRSAQGIDRVPGLNPDGRTGPASGDGVQVTFWPRRAGVVAPWFAREAPRADLPERSLRSIAADPRRSTAPTAPDWFYPLGGPSVAVAPADPSAGEDLSWSFIGSLGENLSRLVAVAHSRLDVPRTRAYSVSPWFGESGEATLLNWPTRLGSATSSLRGEGRSVAGSRSSRRGLETVRSPARPSVEKEEGRLGVGTPRPIYPERSVRWTGGAGFDYTGAPMGSVAWTAQTGTEGIQTAVFSPRLAGWFFERPSLREAPMTGDWLAAPGMTVSQMGGGRGDVRRTSPLLRIENEEDWSFLVPTFANRVEGGWRSYPALGRDEDRTLLALWEGVGFHAESETHPTQGVPSSERRPSLTRTTPSRASSSRFPPRPRSSLISAAVHEGAVGEGLRPHGRPGSVAQGVYGTTLLARRMDLQAVSGIPAPLWMGVGAFPGSIEASVLMSQGLLRLGLLTADTRPGTPAAPRREIGAPSLVTSHAVRRRAADRTPRLSTWQDDRTLQGPKAVPETTPGRYGETIVTRTLSARPAPAGEPRFGWPASAPLGAPGVTLWGFSEDAREVFLRIPWTERLDAVDRAGGSIHFVEIARAGSSPSSRPDGFVPTIGTPSWTKTAGTATGGILEGREERTEGIAWGIPSDIAKMTPRRMDEATRASKTRSWRGRIAGGEDEGTLLVMTRPPRRERSGGEDAVGLGAGEGHTEGIGVKRTGAMWFLQRTLGRALRGLPPESFGEPDSPGEPTSGLVPPDLALLLGIVPTRGGVPGEAVPGTDRERLGSMGGDFVLPPKAAMRGQERSSIVIPERAEARAPGLPEEPVTLEMSLQKDGPAGPLVGPGMVPPISGLIRGGETPGPTLRGLPLVSPVIQAVASQAMMSHRTDAARATPTKPTAQNATDAAGHAGTQPIDLDVLAMEMAERILRRFKREKERRGHHD